MRILMMLEQLKNREISKVTKIWQRLNKSFPSSDASSLLLFKKTTWYKTLNNEELLIIIEALDRGHYLEGWRTKLSCYLSIIVSVDSWIWRAWALERVWAPDTSAGPKSSSDSSFDSNYRQKTNGAADAVQDVSPQRKLFWFSYILILNSSVRSTHTLLSIWIKSPPMPAESL